MHIESDEAVRTAYARDASGWSRCAQGVVRARSAAEVKALMRHCAAESIPLTAAGAQTSTTGASITDRGYLLSLRAMDRVLDVDPAARTVRVEPGVLLGDLERTLADEGLFFAPDPTSYKECTVGGAIACNASGPRTLRYGATRAHVRGLTVVMATGELLEFRRPMLEKNTVGLHAIHDPVDWFVGSEGTLGIIVAAELHLLPRPMVETGLAIPFRDAATALAFIVAARETPRLAPRCLEYFDAESFRIVRTHVSSWGLDGDTLVYAEHAGDTELPVDQWLALAERFAARTEEIRVFDGDAALRKARELRHAVPAAMHERVASFLAHGGRRVSTDWAVPYASAAVMIAQADDFAREAGVSPAVTYGHLGNGHPHQNWVARDPNEVAAVERVVERTLHAVVAAGGTVAAEHGIGKLKARWLPVQLRPVQLRVQRAMKDALDPRGLLAPGNLW